MPVPQKRCLVIQHVGYEGPARIGEVLDSLGWQTELLRPFDGDTVPETVPEGLGALVVLGGPMSVHDEIEYPFLAAEKRLLRAAIDDDFPTIGICLGAQLLAHVAGAAVHPGVKFEIGWFPVAITDKGEADPLMGRTLPRAFQPFHWHGDTFDLPRGSAHLAKSTLYSRQAFRLGENVYGLQFHLEISPALLEAWLPYLPPEVAAQNHANSIARIEAPARDFFTLFFERTGAR